ncbi:MAG TPA: TolC family protein [Candidatus Thioglobus sp.]|jgi:outer membrane protein TolC|nr:TolC family protein [Candidatus Thioglobus sp.]HIL20856.1 TolC family protein [Candidatus Thioglobus sp.]
MHNAKNKILILCFVTLCTEASALSVDEYTSVLIQTHPYFLQLSLSEEASLIDQQAALTYTDWNVRGSVNNSNTSGDHLTSRPYSDLNMTAYEVSVRKNIEQTGGNISLSHSWNRNKRDGSVSGTNAVGVDYSQPLLQNKGGLNDRLGADIAAIEVTTQGLNRAEQSESFVALKIKRLIDLVLAQEKESVYRQQFNLTISQLQLVENKLSSGLVERSELLSELDAKLRAEQQWLQAQQELSLLRQELAALINIQPSSMVIEIDLYQRHDIAQIDVGVVLPQLRLIQQIQLEKQKLLRQRQSLENKLLPSVNLSIGLSTQGEATDYLDGFSNQDQSWRVGVDVSYPLGQNKAKLDLQRSDISLARLNARQREVEVNIKQQISTLVSQVDLLSQMMQTSLAQMQIAEDKLAEEELRYNNARVQKSWLIGAEKSLNMANFAYAQVAASYQKTVVEYRSAIDQLL